MKQPTVEACRARLDLCTMVAERMAEILLRSPSVARVGLYGSVARREPGHRCNDVDLMCFVTEAAEGLEYLHRHGVRTARFLQDLGLAAFREEIRRVTCGFSTPGDISGHIARSDGEGLEDRFVPVSLHVLPAQLDVETMCAFQAAQRDPEFLANIGRDFRIYDPGLHGFMRADPPWTNLPWREHLPTWLEEHREELRRPAWQRPTTSCLATAGGLRVLGALSYDELDVGDPDSVDDIDDEPCTVCGSYSCDVLMHEPCDCVDCLPRPVGGLRVLGALSYDEPDDEPDEADTE